MVPILQKTDQPRIDPIQNFILEETLYVAKEVFSALVHGRAYYHGSAPPSLCTHEAVYK